MSKGITLKELSKILDVSISTVSKSLSDSQEISDETKERVQKIAKALQYTPNYFASNLKKKSSHTIGVVLPTILNPFFAKLLFGIEQVICKQGYKIITCFSNDSALKEARCLKRMSDGSVDGLIVCMARETQLTDKKRHLNRGTLRKIPTVYVDRFDESLLADQVVSDDLDSCFDACQYLVKKHACKNIAFASLMGPLEKEKLRYLGYVQAMKQLGCRNDQFVIRTTHISDLRISLKNLLHHNKIDAVLCTNGSTTSEVLMELQNHNDDGELKIHVAGFCDDGIRRTCRYPYLSIIDQRGIKLGKTAAVRLLDRIQETQRMDYSIQCVKTKLLS